MAMLAASGNCLSALEAGVGAGRIIFPPQTAGRCNVEVQGASLRHFKLVCPRATGFDPAKIGSRRKKRGLGKTEVPPPEDPTEPFLISRVRQYIEDGNQALDDAETLMARSNNSFGFVLEVAAEANEYLRTNRDDSLKRKPILKVLSDRINDIHGDNVRDSYLNERPDYSEFDT